MFYIFESSMLPGYPFSISFIFSLSGMVRLGWVKRKTKLELINTCDQNLFQFKFLTKNTIKSNFAFERFTRIIENLKLLNKQNGCNTPKKLSQLCEKTAPN